MNKKIVVDCDSINGTINIRDDENTLVKMSWYNTEHEGEFGFDIKNADFLISVYPNGFYIIDHPAVMQFIINVAERVAYDQGLSVIEYTLGGDKVQEVPYFMPHTIEDEDVHVLPMQYMEMHDMWNFFVGVKNRSLSDILIDSLAEKGLLVGFLDLVNIDLSLVPKTNFQKELNNE